MGPELHRHTLREILEAILVTKKKMMSAMRRSRNNKVSNYCTRMLQCESNKITDIMITSHQAS